MGDDPEDRPSASLEEVLERSRDLGFLGPGPLLPQIEHARGFVSMVARAPESFLDLGSGGGLPGLVLALRWASSRGVLLDASVRRSQFLREACGLLGLTERIDVVCARAEEAGRAPELRGAFDVVTARSFSAPAVTAECGAPFLRAGGRLLVSEPPEDSAERWPQAGLIQLGLEVETAATPQVRYVSLRRVAPAEDRWPRRTGIPAKRPLWH